MVYWLQMCEIFNSNTPNGQFDKQTEAEKIKCLHSVQFYNIFMTKKIQ